MASASAAKTRLGFTALPSHPTIFRRSRSFKPSDEKGTTDTDMVGFTEYRGADSPPKDLGLPGDIYINETTARLYACYDSGKRWYEWTSLRFEGEEVVIHPGFEECILWVKDGVAEWCRRRWLVNKFEGKKFLNTPRDLVKAIITSKKKLGSATHSQSQSQMLTAPAAIGGSGSISQPPSPVKPPTAAKAQVSRPGVSAPPVRPPKPQKHRREGLYKSSIFDDVMEERDRLRGENAELVKKMKERDELIEKLKATIAGNQTPVPAPRNPMPSPPPSAQPEPQQQSMSPSPTLSRKRKRSPITAPTPYSARSPSPRTPTPSPAPDPCPPSPYSEPGPALEDIFSPEPPTRQETNAAQSQRKPVKKPRLDGYKAAGPSERAVKPSSSSSKARASTSQHSPSPTPAPAPVPVDKSKTLQQPSPSTEPAPTPTPSPSPSPAPAPVSVREKGKGKAKAPPPPPDLFTPTPPPTDLFTPPPPHRSTREPSASRSTVAPRVKPVREASASSSSSQPQLRRRNPFPSSSRSPPVKVEETQSAPVYVPVKPTGFIDLTLDSDSDSEPEPEPEPSPPLKAKEVIVLDYSDDDDEIEEVEVKKEGLGSGSGTGGTGTPMDYGSGTSRDDSMDVDEPPPPPEDAPSPELVKQETEAEKWPLVYTPPPHMHDLLLRVFYTHPPPHQTHNTNPTQNQNQNQNRRRIVCKACSDRSLAGYNPNNATWKKFHEDESVYAKLQHVERRHPDWYTLFVEMGEGELRGMGVV
ncbi:hypothetical protein V5O48_018187 [Marasmius crinis-equi]|uniref:Uncharacterized protein n=1 Tax=Marasmius crinis-equi TaxID=585013 RepID=A0ABR3ELV6_9AGAR